VTDLIKEWFQNVRWLSVLKEVLLFLPRLILRVFGLVWKALLTVVLVAICTGFLFLVIFSAYVKNTLSEDLPVKLTDFNMNQSSVIYYWDKDKLEYAVLDELSGMQGERIWVNYEDLNPWLEKAAVAIEDQRFYDHYGVDWYRTFGAFYEVFFGDSSEVFGGSTITQQLIRNVTQYKDDTVRRKILEIFRAMQCEKTYTKEEIMEWYLNWVFFGERSNGVQAAAHNYFGKDQSELTVAECACIIGITNNPSMYDPYLHPVANKTRQEYILSEMYDQGYIETEAEYKAALKQELVFHQSSSISETGITEVTSWYVDAIIEDVIHDLMEVKDVDYETAEYLLFNAGYQIYSTIDMGVQNIIDQVYSTGDNLPAGYRKSATQDLQSAIVVQDPFTGDILGLSGGLGKKTGSRMYNRATQMLRSPGSTIKPLASYSICLDQGLVHPWTVFDDSDFIKLKGTSWYPNNDDSQNDGGVTLRYALQVSINTVAAQMVDMLTPEVSYDQLVNKLGFTHLVEDKNGFSDVSYAGMALGQLSYGETVREMCQAYTIFCNNGIYTEGRTYSRICDASGKLIYENVPESHVVLKETTAYYMTEMLNNAANRGTGWLSKFGNMAIAGKSGGSSSWHDRWYIAYTPYLLAAVWTGYDIGENMGSSNPATGMWKQVMQEVHKYLGYEDAPFQTPDGMRRVSVCVDTGLLAGEACAHEIRGDRTMTLYMYPSEMPRSVCQAHVYEEICSESLDLAGDDCPADCRVQRSVLDPSRFDGEMTLPDYYRDGKYPKKRSFSSEEAYQEFRETRTYYIADEMVHCRLHNLDPVSGWIIEPKHGYLINPVTGMYYDKELDILIDQYSLWQVDWLTGYLIDPNTGNYVDPHTGLDVFLTDEELAAYTSYRYHRPPGYGSEPPLPGVEEGGEGEGTEGGQGAEGGEGGEGTAPPEVTPGPEPTPEPSMEPATTGTLTYAPTPTPEAESGGEGGECGGE
jgi:penicillin-binding protein 1A